jgi:hypothetical protein
METLLILLIVGLAAWRLARHARQRLQAPACCGDCRQCRQPQRDSSP